MKCIRCQRDSKYPERKERTCPGCNGKFAFEPRAGDPFTDAAFEKAIKQVSADGRVRWGVEHLYYELCRRQRIPPAAITGLFMAVLLGGPVCGILGFLVHPGFLVGVLVAAIAALVATVLRSQSPYVRLEESTFRTVYDRWVKAHGPPAGVIARRPQPAPAPVEPDLVNYSFDRAVIVDRARTADLLLANDFHFENNCAILAVDGYPLGPFETVRAMLKRNPRLQVFALHDATPAGCALAHRLATDPAWFAGQVRVIDVGLRPVHGRRFPGQLLPSKVPTVAAAHGITPWEAAWLGTAALELAAIRPEQVLKRLYRALHQPLPDAAAPLGVFYLPARHDPPRDAAGDGGSSGGDGGGDGFAADAGDADGPADSFG